MTEVQLIHNGRPQGKWLSIEQMIADLTAKSVELGPGDHLIVGACGPARSTVPQRDVRDWFAEAAAGGAEIIPFRRSS